MCESPLSSVTPGHNLHHKDTIQEALLHPLTQPQLSPAPQGEPNSRERQKPPTPKLACAFKLSLEWLAQRQNYLAALKLKVINFLAKL